MEESTAEVGLYETELILHWDMEDIVTKGQVYYRLGKLKDLRQEIESRCEGDPTFPVPKFCNISTCITMEWERYQEWTQGKEDPALDALREQGIIATLPLLRRQKKGTFRPHVWCEIKTKLGENGDDRAREKAVHAILQEYTHPGPSPKRAEKARDNAPIRFIAVVFRTGDRDEWVDFVQSVETVDSGRRLRLYRFDPNRDSHILESLTEHCSQKPGYLEGWADQ
ncbi:hypothetical protein ACJZ2D_008180 [Fusarium nematophilum]